MRNVIAIDPSWLMEAAPHFYQLQKLNTATYWLPEDATWAMKRPGEKRISYPGKQETEGWWKG